MSLEEVNKKLQKYDPYLEIRRTPDGSKKLIRNSPFDRTRTHLIRTFREQIIGSGRWIRFYLQSIDSQRYDLAGSALRHNKEIEKKKGAKESNVHEEVARFISEGEKLIM